MRELDDLLLAAASEDPPTMKEAALCLAMLIERRSPRHSSPTFYDQILPPELAALELSDEDEIHIITQLEEIALRSDSAKPILWALTKSIALEALESLLRFVSVRQNKEQEGAVRQALVGIQIFSTVAPDEDQYLEIGQLFRRYELLNMLTSILSWADPETHSLATRIARNLHELN
jgi:hypothetical protein